MHPSIHPSFYYLFIINVSIIYNPSIYDATSICVYLAPFILRAGEGRDYQLGGLDRKWLVR